MSVLLPINETAGNIDFSNRPVISTAIVGSPATNAETIVCSVTVPNNVQVIQGVKVQGWVAFTVGASGVSATLQIRQTSTSGSSVQSSGAVTVAAGNLYSPSIVGFDTAGVPGQVYKLTLTIGSGAATSTVSKVFLEAFAY